MSILAARIAEKPCIATQALAERAQIGMKMYACGRDELSFGRNSRDLQRSSTKLNPRFSLSITRAEPLLLSCDRPTFFVG
jgi:hypothetical protein